MKTKRMFLLIGVTALGLSATAASGAVRSSPMMARPAMSRPAPRFAPRTMTGTNRFFNNRFDRFHRFHRFNNQTFVFVDTFGFPFFSPFPFSPYPYPYYGYYPYGYSGYYGGAGYGYGSSSRVAELQRRLAQAGYYHGRIDGIMGPQTRRAIRAYERDHGRPAYG
jgi:Putative peptidoglycan binding domain